MKTKKNRDVNLGKDPVGRLLMTLAVPAITSQLINALYNMVDRMYIGHIEGVGAAALTGVGVSFPIIMIISAFASLIGMGGAPRAGIFMGKKDNDSAEKIVGNCFTGLAIAAIILTAVVLIFKEPILYLFGASDNTITYATQYITIYACGTIFVMMTLGMNAFISTQGFSKTSMLTVVIGAVTNIVLDPIFIFLLGLGVRGAAFATIISQAISAIWALKFISGKKTILRLKKENMKLERKVIMPCIALGMAPFIMMSTESLLVLCFNSSLLKYGGDVAVGCMTIATSIMQFAMLPLQGITQGGQPIVSFNYGAKDMQRVKKGFKYQTIACFIYATFMWGAAQLFPGALISMFTNDPELLAVGQNMLRIYMGAVLLMGVQISCQQTFIAFGNAKTSCFLAIFRKILVLIPLIYILPHLLDNKVRAVFMAEPIADVIAVTMTVILFVINFKKVMKQHAPAKEA